MFIASKRDAIETRKHLLFYSPGIVGHEIGHRF